MTGPIYSPTTERMYRALPEHYRDSDAALGYPLKRYLSATGDRLGEVETLLDRIDYRMGDEATPGAPPDSSDLVDPDRADRAWLPWLAQLLGVRLSPGLSEAEQRDAVRFAAAGWRSGTKRAVADAARSALTGSRYVAVYDHTTSTSGIGKGGEWDVLLVTRATETPDVALVLSSVQRQNAAPAGVKLWHAAYEAKWFQVHTALPTWADWNARTWAQVQDVGQV